MNLLNLYTIKKTQALFQNLKSNLLLLHHQILFVAFKYEGYDLENSPVVMSD